ncbi:MAG: hypothetical protein EOP06_13390 [Proteobacteria bacterium]|nr:MAG: hypothetical protein EOP06_13390 [Pseudomonadota bacterium]
MAEPEPLIVHSTSSSSFPSMIIVWVPELLACAHEYGTPLLLTPDRRYSYSTTSPVMIPSSLNGTPVLDGHFAYGTHTHPANGTEYLDGDAPFQGFSSYTAISINDQFHTYLMYLPPGTATHVPLKDLTWSWQASANRLSGTWQIPSKSAQWAAGSEFPAHPVWTNNVNNNTYP